MQTTQEKQNGMRSPSFLELLIRDKVASQVTPDFTINKDKNSEKKCGDIMKSIY